MVYFLGREVAVYFNTESKDNNEAVNCSAVIEGTVTVGAPSGTASLVFADDMNAGVALSSYDQQTDVTGVDISIGATDEDITYIGQMATGKV